MHVNSSLNIGKLPSKKRWLTQQKVDLTTSRKDLISNMGITRYSTGNDPATAQILPNSECDLPSKHPEWLSKQGISSSKRKFIRCKHGDLPSKN
jgi:hypothetical protein